MGVEKARYPGHAREAAVHNHFKDFRECLDENNDEEGGAQIVPWLAWFIMNNAICLFQRWGVEAVAEKRGKEVKYEARGTPC